MAYRLTLLPGGCPIGLCAACADLDRVPAPRTLLLKQRLELLAQINSSHEPFIHRLPVEIASHIFWLCLPQVDLFQSRSIEPWNALLKQANALAGVCWHWRSLAYRTPKLWSNLVFDLSENTRSHTLYVESIRELLERSRSSPLSFIATYNRTSSRDTPIIKLLNAEVHRWHIVHLDMDLEGMERFFMPPTIHSIIARFSAPHNQLIMTRGAYSLDERVLKFSNTGPLLVPVKVDVKDFSFLKVPVDWSRATHVKLGTDGKDDGFVRLLEAAPLLECFECCSEYFDHSHVPNLRSAINHKRLEEYSGMLTQDIARVASFPSLSRLALANHLPVVDVLQPFLRRCSTTRTLSYLSVKIDTDSDKFIELLRELPQLVKFRYSCHIPSPLLLDHFISTAAQLNTGFLPNLESFECHYHLEMLKFEWFKFASLFPSELSSDTADSDKGRRPLKSFKFSSRISESLYPSATLDRAVSVIGANNIEKFIKIREMGYTFIIADLDLPSASMDILDMYIDAQP